MNESLIEKDDSTILGSSKDIESTTKNISKYLAYDIKLDDVENKITEDENFVSKPLVIETNSRQQIEEEKIKKEEEEARALAYSNYTYTNYSSQDYSRNTVVRDYDRSELESNANSYYYGYCTWYVANKKDVPGLWGNAGQWLYSAQNSGYETSNVAKDNSIIVTNESGWGHVGVVESVGDDTITISEMNYSGWGVVNTREIPKDSSVIKGYIY